VCLALPLLGLYSWQLPRFWAGARHKLPQPASPCNKDKPHHPTTHTTHTQAWPYSNDAAAVQAGASCRTAGTQIAPTAGSAASATASAPPPACPQQQDQQRQQQQRVHIAACDRRPSPRLGRPCCGALPSGPSCLSARMSLAVCASVSSIMALCQQQHAASLSLPAATLALHVSVESCCRLLASLRRVCTCRRQAGQLLLRSWTGPAGTLASSTSKTMVGQAWNRLLQWGLSRWSETRKGREVLCG
jgi:hypothetical protein